MEFNTRVQENTRPHKLATTAKNTSTDQTPQGWALISSHPGDEVTPLGPGRTSTVHGCLVRQEGCGWPTTKPLRTRRCELETPSFTSMVVEPQYDHCRQIHLTRHFSPAQCACLMMCITQHWLKCLHALVTSSPWSSMMSG